MYLPVVNAIEFYRYWEYAKKTEAQWQFHSYGLKLEKIARRRAFGKSSTNTVQNEHHHHDTNNNSTTTSINNDDSTTSATTSTPIEVPPKWTTLATVLKEIAANNSKHTLVRWFYNIARNIF
jgi:hypothetical protein